MAAPDADTMESTPLSGTTHLRKAFVQQSHIPTPRQRVTRSQSRELEDTRPDDADRRQRHKGKGLDIVVEEPRPSQEERVIPESPEDVINMSGTTILPGSEPEDLNAELMIEALPDLERAAKNVLNFLILSSPDIVNIVNTAKKLGDPKNKHPQRRMLERAIANLSSNAQYFGNQEYIDVSQVNRVLSPMLTETVTGKDWSSDPILHRANCARFALQILLAGNDPESPRNAIDDLENRFPSLFMSGIFGRGQQTPSGKSSLERDTLNLAMEIRTQSLIMELESSKYQSHFDPKAIVDNTFFVDKPDDESEEEAAIRGFNIDSFEDETGRLPERFRDTVYSRISEIRMLAGEGDYFDLDGLKSGYSWKVFAMRCAQWVRKREEEINRTLKSQRATEDVRDDYLNHASILAEEEDLSQDVTAVQPEERSEQEAGPSEQAPAPDNQERRKSAKNHFRNLHAIGRIRERMTSATGSPKARRQSDVAALPSQRQSRPVPENRRETLPAMPEPRATSPSRAHPRSPSPEDSRTFLHDEEEWNLEDSTAFGPEKSHSPPVRRFTEERRRDTGSTQASQSPERPSGNLAQRVWDSLKGAKTNNSLRPETAARRAPAHFIDRQQDAHRVSPISQDAGSVDRRQTQVQARKRTRPVSDDEDDEFAQDQRPIDLAAKRAQKPEQTSKRQRVDGGSRMLDTLAAELTRPEPERPAATPAPRNEPASAARPSPRKPAGRMGRRNWSEEEKARLVRLIEKYGVGWARILEANNAEDVQEGEARIENRDQVQIKDRARNLQLDFIRRGEPLPKNFDKVTLKSKDFENLQRHGYNIPESIIARMNRGV